MVEVVYKITAQWPNWPSLWYCDCVIQPRNRVFQGFGWYLTLVVELLPLVCVPLKIVRSILHRCLQICEWGFRKESYEKRTLEFLKFVSPTKQVVGPFHFGLVQYILRDSSSRIVGIDQRASSPALLRRLWQMLFFSYALWLDVWRLSESKIFGSTKKAPTIAFWSHSPSPSLSKEQFLLVVVMWKEESLQ